MLKLISTPRAPIHIIPTTVVDPQHKQPKRSTLEVLSWVVDELPTGLEALIITGDLQGYDARAFELPASQRRLMGHAVAEELSILCELDVLPAAIKTGVLLLGDLWAEPKLDKMGGLGDVQQVWRSFVERFRWVAGVAGNHDLFERAAAFGQTFEGWANTYALDGQVVQVDELSVGGVSGIIGAKGKAWRVPERAQLDQLRRVLNKRPDVLIMHQGPDHPEGLGRGEPKLRALLETQRVPLACFGHCYWPDPLATLSNGAQLINADSRVIVLQRAS